jgi:hypothetical protein
MTVFRFAIGDPVQKQGAGYSGPGMIVAAFQGVDGHPRYVVAHRVQGGRGVFYHIYGEGQLDIRPAEEEDDT